MLIINDLHIGVVRSGGTTPQSQEDLRNYLRRGLKDILWEEDYEAVISMRFWKPKKYWLMPTARHKVLALI